MTFAKILTLEPVVLKKILTIVSNCIKNPHSEAECMQSKSSLPTLPPSPSKILTDALSVLLQQGIFSLLGQHILVNRFSNLSMHCKHCQWMNRIDISILFYLPLCILQNIEIITGSSLILYFILTFEFWTSASKIISISLLI